MDDAARFAELFPAIYLRFHRRDGKREEMTGATRGTLLHLANSGPLTVGEIAEHFDRAQSVVSEIVDGLENKGLLERMRDSKDKRRVPCGSPTPGKKRSSAIARCSRRSCSRARCGECDRKTVTRCCEG